MNLPSWADDLREHLARPPWEGFRWLPEAEASAIRAEWLDIWSQVDLPPPLHTHCRERLERCLPLAVGPSRSRRLSKTSSRMTLLADAAEPALVAVSLSHAMPSVCWSLAPISELWSVVEPYLMAEPPAIRDRVERVVKPLEVDDPQVVARAIDAVELWMDDTFWGSRHVENPWLTVRGELDMLALSVHVQRFSEQDPARFASVSCPTLWSQSTLRIEKHPRGLFAFELRFRPAADRLAITRLNERLGTRLPDDLPLDLAASLLRGATLGTTEIDALGSTFDALALRCAAAPSDPHTIAMLQETIALHADDERLLSGVASLASSYLHEGLLFEAARVAREPLRTELLAFLRPGGGRPA